MTSCPEHISPTQQDRLDVSFCMSFSHSHSRAMIRLDSDWLEWIVSSGCNLITRTNRVQQEADISGTAPTSLFPIWIERGIMLNAFPCMDIGLYGTATCEMNIFLWDEICYTQRGRPAFSSRLRNTRHRRVEVLYVQHVQSSENDQTWEKRREKRDQEEGGG